METLKVVAQYFHISLCCALEQEGHGAAVTHLEELMVSRNTGITAVSLFIEKEIVEVYRRAVSEAIVPVCATLVHQGQHLVVN